MSGALEEVLDHLGALVEDARAVPMSASCVVHRGEVLDLVDEARAALPAEIEQARRVLAEREELAARSRAEADRVVEQGRAEAERLVEQAREEQSRLVEATAVFSRAQTEADRLLEQSQAEADRLVAQASADARAMRLQTEDYVDGKLAGFEEVLATTLATVQRGRDRLSGRGDAGPDREGGPDELDEDRLPRSPRSDGRPVSRPGRPRG